MSVSAAADAFNTSIEMLRDKQRLNVLKVKKAKMDFDQKYIISMADILSQENADSLKKFNESMSKLDVKV